MVAGEDFAMLDRGGIDVPKMQRAILVAPLQIEHLVKVAIKDFAAPADVDGVAAHKSFDGGRVEGVVEQSHVVRELVVVSQPGSEARDWQVGDGVEPVEDDAEVFLEFVFVFRLQLCLRPGKKGAVRIVNKCSGKPGSIP